MTKETVQTLGCQTSAGKEVVKQCVSQSSSSSSTLEPLKKVPVVLAVVVVGFGVGGGPMARAAQEGGGGALGVGATFPPLRCRISVPGVDVVDWAPRRGDIA